MLELRVLSRRPTLHRICAIGMKNGSKTRSHLPAFLQLVDTYYWAHNLTQLQVPHPTFEGASHLFTLHHSTKSSLVALIVLAALRRSHGTANSAA